VEKDFRHRVYFKRFSSVTWDRDETRTSFRDARSDANDSERTRARRKERDANARRRDARRARTRTAR